MGDILSAIHDLIENGPHMGTRLLLHSAEDAVQKMKAILHTHWPETEKKHLYALQKSGVAIMNAISGKGRDKQDLLQVLSAVASEIEKSVTSMKVPQNNLGSPPTPPREDQTGVQPPKGEEAKNQKPQQTQQPNQPGQQPQVPDDGQPSPGGIGASPEQPPNQSFPG